MDHLRNINMSYTNHMFRALGHVYHLTIAVVALMIHAVIPSVFENVASNKVSQIHWSMRYARPGSHRILIRRNAQVNQPNWAVYVIGVKEVMVDHVSIDVPCETCFLPSQSGELQYHILCMGDVMFEGNEIAVIT